AGVGTQADIDHGRDGKTAFGTQTHGNNSLRGHPDSDRAKYRQAITARKFELSRKTIRKN
ncbi:MAG: hypothetical protein KAY54_09025, partial [Burkholderiaceae bacterium]|nr:hypothetical protein [Burkholderiaceae bacterium]